MNKPGKGEGGEYSFLLEKVIFLLKIRHFLQNQKKKMVKQLLTSKKMGLGTFSLPPPHIYQHGWGEEDFIVGAAILGLLFCTILFPKYFFSIHLLSSLRFKNRKENTSEAFSCPEVHMSLS